MVYAMNFFVHAGCKHESAPGKVQRRLRTSTMLGSLWFWQYTGSRSPGKLNTGRLPQPSALHCRLRA